MRIPSWRFTCAFCAGWILVSGAALSGASDEDVRALVEQNRQLTQQISAQQKQIDELRARLDHLEPTATEDRATAEFMKIFYGELFGPGKPTAASALRSAQLEMRSRTEWKSPYYWAGFILYGDWR